MAMHIFKDMYAFCTMHITLKLIRVMIRFHLIVSIKINASTSWCNLNEASQTDRRRRTRS